MSLAWRRGGFAAAAAGLLAVDAGVRLVAGEPYPGATALLLAACGLALVPFLPAEVGTPSLRVALVPVLALGSYSILLTTLSVVGIPLTELSIRASVAALVLAVGAATALLPRREPVPWQARREGVALAVLVGIVGVSLAASWDVVHPFPPPGSDWAFYVLYADEVEAQEHLLIDSPYAVGEVRSIGNYPGVGAVYGSLRILDGVASRSLADGIVVAMAVTPLAIYAAAGTLWGVGAGLVAAAAYSVSPVHLEPLYWHGLATTLALAFLPVTIFALGLMYRGRRDWRTVTLLGFSLAGVAAMHSVSAGIVVLVLAIVLAGDVLLGLARRRSGSLGRWWQRGMSRPVLGGIGVGAVLGAGVIVHLRLLAAEAGPPVSFRFFDREWIDLATIDYYFSWLFLALVVVSLAVVLLTRSLRRDAAVASIAALALASVLIGQAWRLHVPFEYRRVVYYVAVAMVMVIGVASVRLGRHWLVVVGYGIVLVAIAQGAIGLRLPERLFEARESRSATVDALEAFGRELDRDGAPSGPLTVADRCVGAFVPYFVRTPVLVAAEEWQVGFANALPAARDAKRLLEGGPDGRRLASELGVRYAVVDPECTPGVAARLDGRAVVERPDLVIVDLS